MYLKDAHNIIGKMGRNHGNKGVIDLIHFDRTFRLDLIGIVNSIMWCKSNDS